MHSLNGPPATSPAATGPMAGRGLAAGGGLRVGRPVHPLRPGRRRTARRRRGAVCGLVAAALLCVTAASAQTYGLWQYSAPAGQPRDGKTARVWQLVQGRSFCQFALYLAVKGTGDGRADFAADWAEFAQARGATSPTPSALTAEAPNGWTRLEATRDEHTAAVGRYRVTQVTFSGHARRMSAVATTNDAALCQSGVDAFVAGLVPLLPRDAVAAPHEAQGAAVPPAPTLAGAPPQITAHSWMQTSASYSHWGSNFSLAELSKLNSGQGYARKTWQFGADGRYRFRLEVWAMNIRPRELSGIEDTGRWRIEGDRVIVEPESAVAYVEDKETRVRLRQQPARTARTVYTGRMHWLSGMGAWYLVLAPLDGRPTDREGEFDKHPSFPNAYLYGPPPKVGG